MSSPDLLAVRDDADKLRVIRLSDGQTLHYLAHARSADELIVAQDAERALTVSGSKLRLWDLDSGQEIGQLTAEGRVRSATLSPAGTQVAFIAERPRETGSGDTFHVAQIWTPEQESAIASFPVVDVKELKIDRSGRLLLLLSHKGSALRVMDLNTLRTLGTVAPLRNGEIQSADSLNDGELLAVTDRGTYMMDNTSARRSALRIVTNDGQLELARIDSDWGRYVATDEANRLDYRGSDLMWHSTRIDQTGSDRALSSKVGLTGISSSRSPRILVTKYDQARLIDTDRASTTWQLPDDRQRENNTYALDKTGATFALVLSDTSNETFELVAFDAMSGSILARHPLERQLWQLRFVDEGKALVGTHGGFSVQPNEADEYAIHWRWPDGAAQVIEHKNPIRGLVTSRDGSLFATVEGYLHEPDEDRGTGARRVGERRVRIWRPEELAAMACDRFYDLDWRRGRVRVTSNRGRHACDDSKCVPAN